MVTSSRSIPAAEFFVIPKAEGDRETALKPNEILTSIEVPIHGLRNATYEIRHRQGLDWPYATASVAFALDNLKTPAEAKVVLGHVAPIPWNAAKAAEQLEGNALTTEAAEASGKAATVGARPLSRNAYKVKMIQTAVKRAILIAAGLQAQG